MAEPKMSAEEKVLRVVVVAAEHFLETYFSQPSRIERPSERPLAIQRRIELLSQAINAYNEEHRKAHTVGADDAYPFCRS